MQEIRGKSPRPNWLLAGPSRLMLRLWGWGTEGTIPDYPKMVILGVPHTTNWDFVALIGGAARFGIKVYWMGKKELFPPVFGSFMKWLGGIPIDRKSRHNVVEQVVEIFNRSEYLYLVIPPEGTRSRAEYWKTGFYHIAQGANVPIVCAYVDYKRKVVGIGPMIWPSGDIAADVAVMAEFYSQMTPKYPENFGPIRIREKEQEKGQEKT